MRARQRHSVTYYYYDSGGKPRREIPLGADYTMALRKWAEINETVPTETKTIAWAIGRYLGSPQFADLGEGSKKDYKYALDAILKAFGDAPLEEVKSSHVTLYIDKRSAESRHRALREKAVLSMIYSWCMARDFCASNPVAVIKTKRLPGRKHVYIDDKALDDVYARAPQDLKDAIDLAYYTGQRPGDILGLTTKNLQDGHLEYRQSKTGTAQRIKIAGGLKGVIDRLLARKAEHKVQNVYLLVNAKGQKLTKAMLRFRFETARKEAGITGAEFQFRDLRRKSGSDMRDQGGLDAAQGLLGHASQTMTEHYTAGRGAVVPKVPERGLK
jgi:integrase